MNTAKSVRVTFVPKFRKYSRQAKVEPFRNQQQDKSIIIQSSSLSSRIDPWTTTSHTNRMYRSKRFLSHSPLSFDVVQQSVKYTSKDLRKKNQEKKKKFPKKCIIIIVILSLLILLGISIYLILHFTTKTNTTKSPVLNSVLRWNTTGITIAGLTNSPGVNASQLSMPVDLALDSSNTLYIADYANSRVQKWLGGASSGATVAGLSNGSSSTTAAGLTQCCGVYVYLNSNLYVTDTYNNRVQLWTNGASAGIRVARTGSPGSLNNQFSNPYGIQQDPDTKTLYIADYSNHRVMSYASGASTGSVVAGGNGNGNSDIQLYQPVGIYLDSFTNSLFIANFAANNIVRWVVGANNWTLIAGDSIGSSGNSPSKFYLCTGVTLDPMGNVYVADTGNHRIQFFFAGQANGTTIAGISTVSGSSSTRLNTPYAVRIDSQLNLYVVDTGNSRVQKFERY